MSRALSEVFSSLVRAMGEHLVSLLFTSEPSENPRTHAAELRARVPFRANKKGTGL